MPALIEIVEIREGAAAEEVEIAGLMTLLQNAKLNLPGTAVIHRWYRGSAACKNDWRGSLRRPAAWV